MSKTTTIGARFASSVDAATEVSSSDQCQTNRSAAKKNPHQKNRESQLEAAAACRASMGSPCRSSSIQGSRKGSASAPRQKAVAVGPVSDQRTKIPALAIAKAPANSAIRTTGCPPAGAGARESMASKANGSPRRLATTRRGALA